MDDHCDMIMNFLQIKNIIITNSKSYQTASKAECLTHKPGGGANSPLPQEMEVWRTPRRPRSRPIL